MTIFTTFKFACCFALIRSRRNQGFERSRSGGGRIRVLLNPLLRLPG
jgi:hypothetical protein